MKKEKLLNWLQNKNGVICSNGVFTNISQINHFIDNIVVNKITLIHVVHANIDYIDPEIFSLKNIKKIELINCNIQNFNIVKCNAKEINLEQNNINSFYLKSKKIRNLFLKNSQIEKLQLHTPNLEVLDVEKNPIKKFSFKNSNKLIKLMIDNNIPVYKNSPEEKLILNFDKKPSIIQDSKLSNKIF